MTRPNAFDADCSAGFDGSDPEGYRCAEGPFGKVAGGKQLAVRLFELPTGQTLCPYHYEYVEEWLLVMSGEVQVRTPHGVEPGRAGDLFCFPVGAEGGHSIWNDAAQPARIVMFSSAAEPAIAVYPDGGKVGVWSGEEHDHWMFRGAEAHLDYYDGELPPRRR